MGRFLGSYHSLLRLKRSNIECVILAGSSDFLRSGEEIAFWVVEQVVFGARSARFFKDFGFLGTCKGQNFFCLLEPTVLWADS